jgi:hypothetical protein
LPAFPSRFFLKRAPFAVPGGGELKLEHVKPAYQVGAFTAGEYTAMEETTSE